MIEILALTSHLITGFAPNETYTVFVDEIPQLEVEVSAFGHIAFDTQTGSEIRIGTLPTPTDEGPAPSNVPAPELFAIAAAPSPTSGPLNVVVSIPGTDPAVGNIGSGLTRVDLFDASGRRVGEVSAVIDTPGTHRIAWDTSSLGSGLYFVRATRGGIERVTRFLVVH